MLRLVGHVAAKVPPDDAVPGGIVLLVKLLKNTQKKKGIQDQMIKTLRSQLAPILFSVITLNI